MVLLHVERKKQNQTMCLVFAHKLLMTAFLFWRHWLAVNPIFQIIEKNRLFSLENGYIYDNISK